MTRKTPLTHQRLRVLAQLRQQPDLAGADLMRLVRLASGSLYPLLYALEDLGFLESRWEPEAAHELGRPRRRLYRLTDKGERAAMDAVAELSGLTRPREASDLP